MRTLVAAMALSLCLTSPAVAANDKESEDQKVICKRQKTLGSNFAAKRVCRTKAEWEEVEEHTKRELRNISDRAYNPTPIPGGPR